MAQKVVRKNVEITVVRSEDKLVSARLHLQNTNTVRTTERYFHIVHNITPFLFKIFPEAKNIHVYESPMIPLEMLKVCTYQQICMKQSRCSQLGLVYHFLPCKCKTTLRQSYSNNLGAYHIHQYQGHTFA